jgi:predicted alpha-1,2-mannosidase
MPGPVSIVVLAAVTTLCSSVLTAAVASAQASSSGARSLVSDPSALVNPFAGTGTAPVASGNPGNIGEFPAADVPFGMMQWGPDTTPHRVEGSGYAYADSRISGFSLTHLSGTGCASYGDIPVLPTVGSIGSHPADASASFSHRAEQASPGRYQVALGRKVTTQLTVTTRTGLARFTFPSTSQANVLLKVADSANPASRSSFRIVGRDQISGQVTSGQFCSTGTAYTLYFTARFNRPFASVGAWSGSTVAPGLRHCAGTACGAFVSFDARTNRQVEMKVGISFVSAADAAQNLRTEDPGWSLPKLEAAARQRWNALLGRVRIGGGSPTTQRTFYTALYHSLLHPNVASDVNGQYMGADQRVHRTKRVEYANFSEWDIYRSEIQLLALVAPRQTGDMVQSLVNDADASGWLPKWEIVGGDASQMNGDSADPIIAAAYAFGVRGFDARAALKQMVKGATQAETGHGLEIERQYLAQYLTQHYVNAGSLDLTSIDYSIGGSVTLEYAIDDFSIAQLAQSLGDTSTYRTMMQRAHNWEYLFNPATGSIQARNNDGSFPPGPAFQSSLFEDGGQTGFEEGNPIQYTWSVPQDLDALGSLMGGDAKAVATLNTFFTHLNAGRYQPYDWAGNEPSLWTPWEYDSFDAPSRTQDVVRRIATTLYSDRPDDEPGNDDLGALSSWYVWATIGLFNVTPGSGVLALSSPLFPRVVITLPHGHTLDLNAPRASVANRYIQSVQLRGARLSVPDTTCAGGASTTSVSGRWTRPWVPVSLLTTGGTLTFGLSFTPDRSWGSTVGDGPPSFATGRLPAVGFSLPSGAMSVPVGTPTTLQLGTKVVAIGLPPVQWNATATGGLKLSTTSGTISSGASEATGAASLHCGVPAPVAQSITVEAPTAGTFTVSVHLESGTTALPPVVVDVVASS